MKDAKWNRHVRELLPLSADEQDVVDPWHMQMAREFVAQINATVDYDSVLDVGCGTGAAAMFFHHAGKHYHGVTSSYHDAQVCWDCGLDCDVAEMSDLPHVDDAFDLIYCRHALEHALALPVTLREFARVAAIAAVVVPAPPNWILQQGHYYTMDRRAWVHLFMACGWEPQAFWNNDGREYRWLLRRKQA